MAVPLFIVFIWIGLRLLDISFEIVIYGQRHPLNFVVLRTHAIFMANASAHAPLQAVAVRPLVMTALSKRFRPFLTYCGTSGSSLGHHTDGILDCFLNKYLRSFPNLPIFRLGRI